MSFSSLLAAGFPGAFGYPAHTPSGIQGASLQLLGVPAHTPTASSAAPHTRPSFVKGTLCFPGEVPLPLCSPLTPTPVPRGHHFASSFNFCESPELFFSLLKHPQLAPLTARSNNPQSSLLLLGSPRLIFPTSFLNTFSKDLSAHAFSILSPPPSSLPWDCYSGSPHHWYSSVLVPVASGSL